MITCTFEDGGTGKLRHVVVHAIFVKDNQILLEKRAERFLEGGKWCLPAGFMGRDETAAECILREVKEETGWEGEVGELFRINTNPNRPKEDRQNIGIEFIVRPIKKVAEGDDESTEVKWFDFDKLPPEKEMAFDHGETIQLYLKYKKHPHPLPIVV